MEFRTPDHLVKSQMLFLGIREGFPSGFNLAELQALEWDIVKVFGLTLRLYLFVATGCIEMALPPSKIKFRIAPTTMVEVNKDYGHFMTSESS